MDENCSEVIFGSLLSFFYTIDRIHPSLYQIFTEYRRGRTQALVVVGQISLRVSLPSKKLTEL